MTKEHQNLVDIPPAIIRFLNNQGFVIVSTMDNKGRIHCSAKGVVALAEEKRILIVDLYLRGTFRNLKRDQRMSLTAVDEQSFKGYTLQGRGVILPRDQIPAAIMANWEERMTSRISRRVVRGVRSSAKSSTHFEAHLPPQPQYLIELKVERLVDLAPPSLR